MYVLLSIDGMTPAGPTSLWGHRSPNWKQIGNKKNEVISSMEEDVAGLRDLGHVIRTMRISEWMETPSNEPTPTIHRKFTLVFAFRFSSPPIPTVVLGSDFRSPPTSTSP